MTRIRTHYDNLQVQEGASPEVIEGAWRVLARKWDPDRHPDDRLRAERVRRIIDHAYRVLSDPRLRGEHDAWIQAQREALHGPEPVLPDGDSPPANAAPRPGTHRRSRSLGLTGITMAWVGAFALMWWLFDDYLDRREFPNRDLVVEQGAANELVLRRNHAGHYLAPGMINGEPVIFLLDTGATQVSVPVHLADRLGLHAGSRGRALTANGPVEVRRTRIRELALGPFVIGNVSGHINPGMRGDQVLLGMSVLSHLDFAQRDGRLILNLP
ncbi:TIGR02281 family clan AA aspartic protease [Thioalkalivibrio sp.]|uniref:TIGR02281 family clan AA aspartic protease n=1 Tax=Thioalkalivibrio sp. TaxID=2093813 RepID=UPI003975F073